jgi:hypothetical protein
MTITDDRRRKIKLARVLFVGAAAAAAFALFSAAHPGDAPATTGVVGHGSILADGDDNFVNDNGQTSGDIFQQNAQSQGN